MGTFSCKMWRRKQLLIATVLLFVAIAWVPCFEATLHWNPTSFWDIRNPRQWDRENVPLQVEIEEPIVQALSPVVGDERDFTEKPIKVSPIGMFSYLLRMAEASKRKRCRNGETCQKKTQNINFKTILIME